MLRVPRHSSILLVVGAAVLGAAVLGTTASRASASHSPRGQDPSNEGLSEVHSRLDLMNQAIFRAFVATPDEDRPLTPSEARAISEALGEAELQKRGLFSAPGPLQNTKAFGVSVGDWAMFAAVADELIARLREVLLQAQIVPDSRIVRSSWVRVGLDLLESRKKFLESSLPPAPAPAAPNLLVSCVPSSIGPVTAGGTAFATCDVTSLSGFSGQVLFACSQTQGISCAFQPDRVTLTDDRTFAFTELRIDVGAQPPPGSAVFNVVVQSGNLISFDVIELLIA